MRTLLFLLSILITAMLYSCQPSLEPIDNSGGADSSTNSLLIRTVSFNTTNDSFVTNYEYNAKGHLIKTWSNNDSSTGFVRYLRDDQERIIRVENVAGSTITTAADVHYTNANSGNLSYTVSYKTDGSAKRIDSLVYTYDNGKLSHKTTYWPKEDTMAAVYYETLRYDARGNIIKSEGYTIDNNNSPVFNIGYDLEYDNHPNPRYSHDDIINYDFYLGSPNNATKQINHYSNSVNNDDYVINEYEYDQQNRPVVMKWYGPFVDTMRLYFYYK